VTVNSTDIIGHFICHVIQQYITAVSDMSELAAVVLVSVFTAVECHLFADCDDAHVTGDTYG